MTSTLSRALGLLFLLTYASRAELQLFVLTGTGERAAAALEDIGQAAVGDTLVARFRLRNTGAAGVSVRTLSAQGMGFSISAAPPLPRIVTADQPLDFSVTFRPEALGNYSAVLQVESISVMLVGTAAAAVSVFSGGQRLGAGGAIAFGSVDVGASARRTVMLENQTPTALLVPPVVVAGTAFRLEGASPSGTRLDPGGSVHFEILFEPAAAGAHEGTLQVGGRGFVLSGTGVALPLPELKLQVDLAAAASARQGRVAIDFDSASRVAASGTLTLSFQPWRAGASDPTIVFANGSREAAFTVNPGAAGAVFGDASSLAFQTGTTAGTLVFTARLGDHTARAAVEIAPAGVVITAAEASRGAASIEVRLTGYDNTRTAASLAFTFFDNTGTAVSPGLISADAGTAFAGYFATSQGGGAFLLKAVFPVTGDIARIDTVEVQIANSVASTKTARVKIP